LLQLRHDTRARPARFSDTGCGPVPFTNSTKELQATNQAAKRSENASVVAPMSTQRVNRKATTRAPIPQKPHAKPRQWAPREPQTVSLKRPCQPSAARDPAQAVDESGVLPLNALPPLRFGPRRPR